VAVVSVRILTGDCRDVLGTLPDGAFNACVTSPPYFGLRSYLPADHPDKAREIGCEPTPDAYVETMVGVFREVRRLLRDDGVAWINIGDSFAGHNVGAFRPGNEVKNGGASNKNGVGKISGLKPKDLIGIPWMLAFALRSDGWWLRGDHVWGKPNGMPESTKDRPTRSHEYVFLLSKSERYWFDAEAVRTAPKASSVTRLAQNVEAQTGSERANGGAKTNGPMKAVRASDKRGHTRRHAGFNDRWDAMERDEQLADGANLRSIWWVSPAQYREAHFAVMPDMVAEICIRSGCPAGGHVLDPFGGAGTTGLVADRLGRNATLIELNPEPLARARIEGDAGMFAEVA
jgi:DNA modification methylase